MKTNTKNTLKKLGLGASAFACLMSMGVNVNAAETSVSFSTMGNSVEAGGGTNGNAQWYATVPQVLEISKVGEEATGEIKITTYEGKAISTVYTTLLIKVEVESTNNFSLKGVNNENNTVTYALKDTDAGVEVSKTGVDGVFETLLGTGQSSSSGSAQETINISALIEKGDSTIDADTYRDTLTFKFTEDTAQTEGING